MILPTVYGKKVRVGDQRVRKQIRERTIAAEATRKSYPLRSKKKQ